MPIHVVEIRNVPARTVALEIFMASLLFRPRRSVLVDQLAAVSAELRLQAAAQAPAQAALQLRDALPGDREALRDGDQCRRRVTEQAITEDLGVAAHQSL